MLNILLERNILSTFLTVKIAGHKEKNLKEVRGGKHMEITICYIELNIFFFYRFLYHDACCVKN